MQTLKVIDTQVVDRKGTWTSVWIIYYGARVIAIEFTRGNTCLTERVEFDDDFKPAADSRPWLRSKAV